MTDNQLRRLYRAITDHAPKALREKQWVNRELSMEAILQATVARWPMPKKEGE